MRMRHSVEAYYDRKALTFSEIALSSQTDRNPGKLVGRSKLSNPLMEEIALGAWIFPTLPGTNPAAHWPQSLQELYQRLNSLKPLTLWTEPFDEQNVFQEAAYKFIDQSLSQNDEKGIQQARLAFLNTLIISLNSGSYDRIVSFLSY